MGTTVFPKPLDGETTALQNRLVSQRYSYDSEAAVKTGLTSIVSQLENNSLQAVEFYTNYVESSDISGAVIWCGILYKYSDDYFSVNLVGNNGVHLDIGYSNGTWNVNNINSKVDEIAGHGITYGVSSLSELQTLISNTVLNMVDGSAAHFGFVCDAAFNIFPNGGVYNGFVHKINANVYQFDGISVTGEDVSVVYNWGNWIVKSLSSKITNLIKYETVTGTTDATGNFGATGSFTIHNVFKVIPIREDPNYYATWYYATIGSNTSGSTVTIHCAKPDGTPVVSQPVQMRVYYLDV